ncbi:MAG: hypothetical protein M1366_04185 [Patescibacteria group bacterium]|nr:hypothetical protein [Patescibacteria group bacterium]
MPQRLIDAILRTLSYADIFSYPLRADEIYKYLIGIKSSQRAVEKSLKNHNWLGNKDGMFFLNGRKKLVDLRKKRESWSGTKMEIAGKAANILRYIPSIMLVGVTGALALQNADMDDDIDFIIISSSGCLWLTRFLSTILFGILGQRRKRRGRKIKNKICLNMFMEAGYLQLAKNERDLFAAHEVVQLVSLWEKSDTYFVFMKENIWAEKFLPNAVDWKNIRKIRGKREERDTFFAKIILSIFRMFESLFMSLQIWYMKGRLTSEVVSPHYIRFHPHDVRSWVMKKYLEKVK